MLPHPTTGSLACLKRWPVPTPYSPLLGLLFTLVTRLDSRKFPLHLFSTMFPNMLLKRNQCLTFTVKHLFPGFRHFMQQIMTLLVLYYFPYLIFYCDILKNIYVTILNFSIISSACQFSWPYPLMSIHI